MILLRRSTETVELTPLLWDALQSFAKQWGWRPAGALDVAHRTKHPDYSPGRLVWKGDARNFATALERFVNAEAADAIDLPPIVALVNFLRGGAFEIFDEPSRPA